MGYANQERVTFGDVFNPAPKGVWAHLVRDHYETIESVYPSEVEALRACVAAGHGRVVYLPYGATVRDLEA